MDDKNYTLEPDIAQSQAQEHLATQSPQASDNADTARNGLSAAHARLSMQEAPADRSYDGNSTCESTAGGCVACPITGQVLDRLLTAVIPKPFRKRHPILFWGGIVLLLGTIIGVFAATGDESDSLWSEERIAVVRVEGMIADTRPLLRWIEKIRKNDNVKGVLLRIDSPGGGAAASQELFDALQKLGKQKPMAASLGSVAASGGLMVAMAAPYVVANPSTVTGSIGVRMDIPQLQGLLGKIGVGKETITTGRYKDAGSPTRALSEDERTYFARVLQDMHEQFVLLVAEGRHLPPDTVRAFADGRIMTGREAMQHKLVDALGGQDVAVAWVRKKAGLSSDASLLEAPKKQALLQELLESVLQVDLSGTTQVPAFLYAF